MPKWGGMKKNDNESQIFAGDVDVFRPFFF